MNDSAGDCIEIDLKWVIMWIGGGECSASRINHIKHTMLIISKYLKSVIYNLNFLYIVTI